MEVLRHMDNIQFLFHNNRYICRSMSNMATDMTLLVYFLYPETAGRTLEDIDRIFVNHVPLLILSARSRSFNRRMRKSDGTVAL